MALKVVTHYTYAYRHDGSFWTKIKCFDAKWGNFALKMTSLTLITVNIF